MGEPYRTLAEIEQLYPNEWVLLDEPRTGRTQQVFGGRVVFHSPDKLAVYDRAKELPTPFDISVWYTGLLEDDAHILNLGLFL